MIKGKWQGIVFIFLILLLAVGLSSIALNEQSEEEEEKTEDMSIALVNEDAGTDFNESPVNFGDEFANRMNKDQSHDWYIVSRGVAESGFERNVYDMMIVIPNNFSENALSIYEDSPEQVSLEYKINATGHEEVRAEAEKTAGEILTNFNKELIDVFFVSIIGNLQEAQDHIVDIIQKEKEYTDEYRVNIFNPLDNFTNQFDRVQQYADMSKNNYNQLDDVLNNFESNLNDKAETSAEYDEDLAEALEQKEENSTATSSFADTFDEFYEQMTREEAIDQLAQVNGNLYDWFRDRNTEDETDDQTPLQERLQQLNSHFERLKSDVEEYEDEIKNELSTEMQERIENGVANSFDGDKMQDIKLIDLINDLDENILENMNQSIGMLPESSIDDLYDVALPESTKTTLQNVAIVSEAFEKEEAFSTKPEEGHPRSEYSLLEEPFKQIETELKEDGIQVTDTILIEEVKKDKFNFSLDAPDGFIAKDIEINGQTPDEDPTENKVKVTLERENGEGELPVEVRATFILNEVDQDNGKTDDFFFQPVNWNWTLDQYDEKTETETTPPNDSGDDSTTTPDDQPDNKVETLANEGENKSEEPSEDEENKNNDENNGNTGNDENNGDNGSDGNNGNDESDENDGSTEDNGNNGNNEDNENDENNGDNGSDGNTGDNGSDGNTGDNGNEDNGDEVEITIKESHYYWNQSVETSLFDQKEFTGDLIEEAVDLYEAIDSLNTMYDLYFGLDLTMDPEELEEKIEQEGLTTLAEDDSLYYLVHKKEIKEIIQNRISKDVEDSILEEMDEPLTEFERNINSYTDELGDVQEDSTSIVTALNEASDEAKDVNSQVREVLDEVDAWKNTSDDLMSEQMDVIDTDSDMQSAILNLDSGFKPILSTSESLAEQAEANFDSTEQVYDTLDSIDEQADTIQESGTTLISQANDLASKFSEKAADDMDFAENFNEVLDNSRIGDRQNEDLYSFLSNPVESKNTGIIKETQSFTPYFVIFIMSIIAFFTAYVLSNHRSASGQVGEFETDQTFIQKNMRPMMMTGGIGLIEGILIGIISFILLDIPQSGAFTWMALITTMMLGMVLIATYALRQLQMIGMFLLLVVFSLYLLLTKSLGFQFGGNEAISIARKISPLQQLENWITSFIDGTMGASTLTMAFIILIAAVIIGLALNMLIIDRGAKEVGIDDERTKEAN